MPGPADLGAAFRRRLFGPVGNALYPRMQPLKTLDRIACAGRLDGGSRIPVADTVRAPERRRSNRHTRFGITRLGVTLGSRSETATSRLHAHKSCKLE